ncbi:Lrp/AsnC family transcriptional regulator [Paroceanicella profunda]|uniref:Lrp/AsnC family transcriptional regulator n=1 Tax=Paroceanicella profunda TaxID=2579971 RepID=A0A5B8FTF8_9RHOB|nr:Lrp/AsnC family transcriptional regulator [Paroceanicella profunda]QDL92056.1 Lrp/AsnC family transcriptional regulator [Paroceanicella profunda]
MLRLDDRDIRILELLSREARLSKAELARRINLSPTPCWERLKRLEAAGIIRSYRAEVSLRGLAPHVTVFVTVELERHHAESFAKFERVVAAREEVVGAWALGGGFDYLLQVVTRDIESYQALIDSFLAAGLGLARYYTYVVTKAVKHSGPPLALLLGQGEGAAEAE